eukprot:GHVU01073364.1.p2 GENE.GHVU01073364.1~~GHVU01073364.1.p2  ORF type:complete len:217 (+),score=42.17 GHVU01073364.1:1090-1740(+)
MAGHSDDVTPYSNSVRRNRALSSSDESGSGSADEGEKAKEPWDRLSPGAQAGVIVGASVGGIAIIGAFTFIGVYYHKKNKKAARAREETAAASDDDTEPGPTGADDAGTTRGPGSPRGKTPRRHEALDVPEHIIVSDRSERRASAIQSLPSDLVDKSIFIEEDEVEFEALGSDDDEELSEYDEFDDEDGIGSLGEGRAGTKGRGWPRLKRIDTLME